MPICQGLKEAGATDQTRSVQVCRFSSNTCAIGAYSQRSCRERIIASSNAGEVTILSAQCGKNKPTKPVLRIPFQNTRGGSWNSCRPLLHAGNTLHSPPSCKGRTWCSLPLLGAAYCRRTLDCTRSRGLGRARRRCTYNCRNLLRCGVAAWEGEMLGFQ